MFDLPHLLRHPDWVQSLDSARLLTRGSPLSLRNFLLRITPAMNRYGVLWNADGKFGGAAQMIQRVGEKYSQMTFLSTPPEAIPSGTVSGLEGLIRQAGVWGSHFLACELPAESDLLPVFRHVEFNIWAHQTIFRFRGATSSSPTLAYRWRLWNGSDIPAMVKLHRGLVPSLFQPIEPVTRKRMLGLVLYHADGHLLGYADLDYGSRGIWVLPFLLPEADDSQVLIDLVASLPAALGRPIFICARSYQPWLADMLRSPEFEARPEEVLLVRYLVVRAVQAEVQTRLLPEAAQGERSVPLTPIVRAARRQSQIPKR